MADIKITNAEKAACAKRELGLRRRAYPRWIEKGTITQAKADREIEVMKAIWDEYEQLAEADREAATPTLL